MVEVKKTMNVEQDVRGLVAEVLEVEPAEINPEAHFVKDLGMDSMMALEILAGIEKMYRIIIPEEMLQKFTSLNQTVKIVKDIVAGKKV